ncbi:MAG: hypothetical protein O2780_15230 [Proteobacteria bacterium]|nr:hypothetical protein [Pseudomonadota bacterium]MDA1302107.1 hypothetical protein [Pseudomonadota bacterium]
MRVLLYGDLNPATIPGFKKIRTLLEANDFASADVRKVGNGLYRARLNIRDRLLFTLRTYQGNQCVLVLEHIRNHAYDRSRFIGGAHIDEDRIPVLTETPADDASREELVYLHPSRERFHLLDKVLSFDDDQQAIYETPAPLVVVGSAGSGKTALTLEKMKQYSGDVLYVSLSPYLVQNARNLYFANGYDNDAQQVDFLSFEEFLETIHVPEGREVTQRDVQRWFARHRQSSGLRDSHQLFEEFRGVITGPFSDHGHRTRDEYLQLGIKQSIFLDEERPKVYELFEKYVAFLDQETLYDANLVSHAYRERIEPRYDFVVVDEVQDITTIQLYLLLKSLRRPAAFLLSGDSNQIVHPNFFSWANVKSLFFQKQELVSDDEIIRFLSANYRNAPLVTEVANRVLKLKHARFGSVDRESHYLVRSTGSQRGRLQLLPNDPAVMRDLDARTSRSTRFAVIVMHPEQKTEASQRFSTPLVFSVQEAKGLEYDSVILYNFVGGETAAFREIASGVDPSELDRSELVFGRSRDKRDKSLEIYKFFINALYVAITRAVHNLYIIEPDHQHPALRLLELDQFTGDLDVDRETSTSEDWQREARKLELQGKQDQAEAIRERVLEQTAVPWTPLDRAAFSALGDRLARDQHKKVQLQAFEYAIIYHHRPTINQLANGGFKPAQRDEKLAYKQLNRSHFMIYDLANTGAVFRDVEKYGIDHRTRFNLTPLMIAARLGKASLVRDLIDRGADIGLHANNGFIALHFALEQALLDPTFARNRLPEIYSLLEPDHVDVEIDARLTRLDKRSMESVLVHLMLTMFYRHLPRLVTHHHQMYNAPFLTEMAQCLPDSVLPERRKKRPYLSSILSKNELERDDPYNRRLFLRMRHGHYVLNPGMKLRWGDRWQPLHQLFPLEDLDIEPPTLGPAMSRSDRNRFGAQMSQIYRDQLDYFCAFIREQI